MEETEDENDINILSFTSKTRKSKSFKNCLVKKYKRITKKKYQIDSIQKIFEQGITSNNPVKIIFTSDNFIRELPVLSNNINNNNNNNNNKDEYLVINEEMKINKNVLENNLYNLLKIKKTKSHKNINDKNLFNSLLLGKSEQLINKEDLESLGTEDQKSIESLYGKGKGTTSPSSNGEGKIKNISSIQKKQKIKIKSLRKTHKKKISLIKILNKPFCFISKKHDNNNNILKCIQNLNSNLNPNNNISNDSKLENNRYNNNNFINSNKIERKKTINMNKLNIDSINRVKSGVMKLNIPNYNNKRSELHLTKNHSANNVSNIINKIENNKNEPQSSIYQFKLNLLRSRVSKLTSNFSIFHFFKTNNIYIFIKNSKYKTQEIGKEKEKEKENAKINILLSNENKIYEIEDDFFLPAAYRPRVNKWPKMPECIENSCKRGGIELINNIDNCNVIWKLTHPNKMREIIRVMNRNQKFNHYPCTFQLGRKDNLYKHIKNYRRMFPDLYTFLPATYLIPSDAKKFENDFKKNKKALWIVKPVNMSRGRGVHILKGEEEFKYLFKKFIGLTNSHCLISRYIDKPHLINKKKYDLRIYVLVVSFSPLRIYIYNNGLVRFATENYKKSDFDNVFIHLTNYSINKNNLKYKPNHNSNLDNLKNNNEEEGENMEDNEDIIDDNFSKWSLVEYRHFFKKMGNEKIMDKIWKQIEDIVIKTILTVYDEYYKEISLNKINCLFELYGFDILIDENYKAWLMEVNVNPSLHCTSTLDLNIKTDLITDIFNIVGIIPYNHNNGETVFNYIMKKTKIDFDINNELFPKLRFTSNNFFNLYNDLESYVNLNKINNNNSSFPSINNSSLMSVKSIILRNFNPLNLRQKLPEYDNEFYKKIIEIYEEEKARSELTDFKLIFPLKENIEFYSKIFIRTNCLNDSNIITWEYILNQ